MQFVIYKQFPFSLSPVSIVLKKDALFYKEWF